MIEQQIARNAAPKRSKSAKRFTYQETQVLRYALNMFSASVGNTYEGEIEKLAYLLGVRNVDDIRSLIAASVSKLNGLIEK